MNPLAPLYRIADRLRYRRHGNLGQHGEDLAHRYLRRSGFTVVARNWRPPQGGGEIDIVAWEGDRWCSSRSKRAFRESGARQSGISTREKIHALRRAARDYVRRSGADESRVRFDVISITGEKLEHLRDAFPLMSGQARYSGFSHNAGIKKRPHHRSWVIISTDRARRPSDFIRESTPREPSGPLLPVLSGQRKQDAARGARLSKRFATEPAGLVVARDSQ